MAGVAVPTFGVGVVTTGLAIATTYATDGKYGAWAWAVVVALTLAGFGLAMLLHRRQTRSAATLGATVTGNVRINSSNNSVSALTIDTVNMTGGLPPPPANTGGNP